MGTRNKEVDNNNVINLDMRESSRRKIWINGDSTKVIELNLSDMGILTRLNDAYPKLDDLVAEVKKFASAEITDEDNAEQLGQLSEKFKEINQKMKDLVNYIFDYNVCDVCCDGGSMYDLVNGQYRFEYIIDKLSALYETTINEEYKRIQARMATHTSKYTSKKRR